MGIPHYFWVISQSYNGVITNSIDKVDHFFIDFNGMIHTAAHVILKEFSSDDIEAPEEAIEEAICIETWNQVLACKERLQPSRLTYICTDGVAPLAKITQQRKRRYLSCFAGKNKDAMWDRNAISPHTPFMNNLSTFIKQRLTKEFYFSDAQEPGEGEHKIFAKVATLPTDDTVCVHGLDADLIMLALCSHKRHISLMRENQDGSRMYLDIDKLRLGILSEISLKYQWKCGVIKDAYSVDAKNAIESYVVLCFLHGNDFIPHMLSLPLKGGGYTRLLHAAGHAYEQHPEGLVVDNAINSGFLLCVLEHLCKDEDATVLSLVQDYHAKRPAASADPIEMYPLFNKHPLVEKILMNPKGWRSHYYKELFGSRDTSVIKTACRTFLTGIYWTYAYYKRMPKNQMYMYPYGYAPTILDLYNYLSISPDITSVINKDDGKTIDPIVQLMTILPPQSMHLLPSRVHSLITEPQHGCAYMFVDGYEVQTFLKTYLWECNPILPHANIGLLETCVREITYA